MALYRVEPTQRDTVNVFSAAHEPVVTVEPGDTIVVRTSDAVGYLERQEFPGDIGRPTMFTGDFRGHCLCRPVAVRGAEPGDMLKVEIVSLAPDTWGWTASPGHPGAPVPERLGLGDADRASLLWEIDAEAGTLGKDDTRRVTPHTDVSRPARAGSRARATPTGAYGLEIEGARSDRRCG